MRAGYMMIISNGGTCDCDVGKISAALHRLLYTYDTNFFFLNLLAL